MSAIDVPPGWHPDPADPASSYRWWDGTQWTEHTRLGGVSPAGQGFAAQPAGPAPAGPPPVQAPATWSGQGPGSWNPNPTPTSWQGNGSTNQPFQAPVPASFARRNQGSLTAIGVAALYVLIAVASHVVFFGIVPAAAAFRAFKRREPLAPVAAVAAGIAIVVAFTAFAH